MFIGDQYQNYKYQNEFDSYMGSDDTYNYFMGYDGLGKLKILKKLIKAPLKIVKAPLKIVKKVAKPVMKLTKKIAFLPLTITKAPITMIKRKKKKAKKIAKRKAIARRAAVAQAVPEEAYTEEQQIDTTFPETEIPQEEVATEEMTQEETTDEMPEEEIIETDEYQEESTEEPTTDEENMEEESVDGFYESEYVDDNEFIGELGDINLSGKSVVMIKQGQKIKNPKPRVVEQRLFGFGSVPEVKPIRYGISKIEQKPIQLMRRYKTFKRLSVMDSLPESFKFKAGYGRVRRKI